ncbi:Os10g0578050 [Oryza sativa Japonica Group]|uniref:Os10g0578050 protein n=2 Tax=Oryza sativa subsp. japonica TaxID=39947 RepID=B7EHG8_ORYSJ|nr:hypothetical protein EE612_052986 [Oryza sativa]KAF2914994.1 hypothetical protein DAI22_10g205650 [Oryza sativa Japonica Group]KAB8113844.1 hypothetical protein EE612_052986 [Oryza sativa]BAG91815.1 unnamed protein product [Oryza sativa Japonica Group]BAH95017.1 Os10g0578100 [Oryza sativa Japonica Group]|eukprot:NP_001176289.1 Os10g0578100 [Oryza sativa Japonica Group]
MGDRHRCLLSAPPSPSTATVAAATGSQNRRRRHRNRFDFSPFLLSCIFRPPKTLSLPKKSPNRRRLLGLREVAGCWVYGRARPAGDLDCRIGRGSRPAVGGSGRAACRSSSRPWLSRGRPSCCMLWLWL